MRRRLLMSFVALLLSMAAPLAVDAKFTLVIDAGHGGHDAGAQGAFSKEKDINLSVALAFGRYVERNCPDVKVVYTRKTDVFIPLMERANIANRHKADLFISVHTNALPKGKIARGFETYTLGMHRAKDNLDVAMRENAVIVQEKNYQQTYQGFDPRSSESYIIFELMQSAYMERSVDLATMIQKSVCATAGRPDKGVHQAGFLVLRETSMPSCLIELGFITTPDEEQLLNQDSQADLIAQGIYKAFVQYKGKYQNGGAAPVDGKGRAIHHDSDNVDRMPAIAKPDLKDLPPADVPTPAPSRKAAGRQQRSAVAPVKEEKATSQARTATGQASKAVPRSQAAAGEPVFKVQIFVSNRKLRDGDSHFKGLTGCGSYEEGGMYKYTYGASTNYNEIYRLRKDILGQFPECFIIAFKDGKKMDVNAGIREFKQNRNKK